MFGLVKLWHVCFSDFSQFPNCVPHRLAYYHNSSIESSQLPQQHRILSFKCAWDPGESKFMDVGDRQFKDVPRQLTTFEYSCGVMVSAPWPKSISEGFFVNRRAEVTLRQAEISHRAEIRAADPLR